MSHRYLRLAIPPFTRVRSGSQRGYFHRQGKMWVTNGAIRVVSPFTRIHTRSPWVTEHTHVRPSLSHSQLFSTCVPTPTRGPMHRGVIFVKMVSAGTRTRTRVTVGGPRACRMDSKTLSSLTRHAGHILCDAKASEECYKPTSRFPRPFPPGPTYDTSSGASTTTTGSAISSVGSPLSNIGPIFTGP